MTERRKHNINKKQNTTRKLDRFSQIKQLDDRKILYPE